MRMSSKIESVILLPLDCPGVINGFHCGHVNSQALPNPQSPVLCQSIRNCMAQMKGIGLRSACQPLSCTVLAYQNNVFAI